VETGRVTVRLHLDSEGRVREVSLVEASPQGYFEAATRRAALQWRCLPPAEAGETLRVPFEFGIAAH
jgi:TonB family protein